MSLPPFLTPPNYVFAPSTGAQMNACCVAGWASGNPVSGAVASGTLAVPLWTEHRMYAVQGSSVMPVPLPAGASDVPEPHQARTGYGYRGVVPDGTFGLWIMADADFLVYADALGASGGYVVPVATGTVLVGVASTGNALSGNTVACVDASGNVHMAAYPYRNQTGFVTPGFGQLSKGATADLNYLYTALPLAGEIGLMALSSHALSTLATPMLTPGFVAAAPNGLAVAGWSYAAMATGMSVLAPSPVAPASLALMGNATLVALMTGPDPNWSFAAPVTGLSGVASIAWTPNATQVLVTDSTGIHVYNVVAGNLSAVTTLAAAGAGQIAITADAGNALACRPAANSVVVAINTVGAWTPGTPVTVTSPIAVAIVGSETAYVVSGTNLVPLSRSGNAWTAGTAIPLGFQGRAIWSDSSGVYVAGGSGTSGALSWYIAGVLVGTKTWSTRGYGAAIQVLQGQVAVLLSDGATILTFGAIQGLFQAEQTLTSVVPSGCTTLGATYQSVWAGSPTAMWQSQWGRPFEIRRRHVGEVALFASGNGWFSAALGIGHDLSALAWDASGNIWAATAENDLYGFLGNVAAITGSTLPLLAYEQVPAYPGQVPGTPMGMSSLTWVNGGLYATTAFAGAVIRVI